MKRNPSVTQPVTPPLAPNGAPFAYHDWIVAKQTIITAMSKNTFYALVTGASGTGKTSLCHAIASSLPDPKFQLLYLSASRVSLLGVVRYFAQLLRVPPRRSTVETTKVLADVISERSTKPILWIDEADRIPVTTLTELRSLVEFDHQPTGLVSLVLSGPPQLKISLDAPELFALKRRLTIQAVLCGLRRDELDPFVTHRFGEAARRLTAAVKDELFERTHGTPALIHRVVTHALACTSKTVGDGELTEALNAAGL